MTPIDALKDLLAKIEAGDDAGFRRANRTVFSTPCQDMNLQMREENCRYAYKGSLDAAKALHEAVLPEREWSIDECGDAAVGDGSGDWICTANTYPARAWLIAILKALIAQEPEA